MWSVNAMGEKREGLDKIKEEEGEGQVWESKSQTAEGFRSITSVGATALSAQWGCEQRNLIGC